MSFAVTPKAKGDEEKVTSACGVWRRRTRRSSSGETSRRASSSSRA